MWTDAQKRDARNYEPGMVVSFHKATPGERHSTNGKRETNGGFAQGETAVVLEGGSKVVLGRADGTALPLPAEYANRFEVYKSERQNIARGDRIRITKNGKVKVAGQAAPTAVSNGDIYPVEGFTKEGDFRLPGGKLLPRNYGHLTMGYVMTSQRVQGNTVDNEFIDWNSNTLAAVNQQAAYVSASRFRENITVFVNSKDAVKEAMTRGGERLSALELMKGDMGEEKVTVHRRFNMHRHLERNRIGAYLRRPVEAVKQAAQGIKDLWQNRKGIRHG